VYGGVTGGRGLGSSLGRGGFATFAIGGLAPAAPAGCPTALRPCVWRWSLGVEALGPQVSPISSTWSFEIK